MKKSVFSFLLIILATLVSPALAADTLEVFVLRVQFKEEKPDNSLTTGLGTFGTIPTDKYSYDLDPPKQGGSPVYWQKHLEFANNYFQAASGGKVAIRSRIFPIYTLNKKILDYNRTEKMDGEKTAEFDEARSRDYLTFIYDAVVAAASKDESENSPFRIPLSKNPSVKRAYMIAHAGSSRLVDGGSMGTKNANTPGDFIDVYVSDDAWEYLMPDSARSELVRPTKGVNETGDTVVNGLKIKNSVLDTLKSIMVVSEAASQDGLNWGINGIVVNQLAREMGLPNTYDMVKGISRLGYYDLMDFAGYSAGNGFLPSMPAAWERSYMGWSKVKEVRPTAGKPVQVKVGAAGTGLGDAEIVKVPLSGSEYLLIENRQRSWNSKGTVDVSTLSRVSDEAETTVKTVSVDSLNLVFEDSVCVKTQCKPNAKKSKGLIVGLSSYDAGIPASGIAVWKVNEWYLRESLKLGAANLWGGKNNRDHQFGISLVEADNVLSIGKTFKNSIGEETYDYGSGTDLLPHQRIADRNSKEKFSAVTTINPTGYANTATTQGGYTGIKIKVDIPAGARKEKTANAFMGDSVMNYGATVITVTISIDDGSIDGSKFPRELGLNTAVRGAVFLDNPKNPENKFLVVGAENGTVQAFSALGDTLFMSTSDLKKPNLSKQDSEKVVPLYELYDSTKTKLIGMAGNGKKAISLHEGTLMSIDVDNDGELYHHHFSDFGGDFKATAGPVIENIGEYGKDGQVWFAGVDKSGKSILTGTSLSGFPNFSSELPDKFIVHDMALCEGPNTQTSMALGQTGSKTEVVTRNYVVMGSTDGRLMIALPESDRFLMNGGVWESIGDEKLNVACTDMNRDGTTDVVFVGSRGSVGYVPLVEYNNQRKFTVRKKQYYKRGATGSSGIKDETSGIAIGDINNDGYPEVVFLGDNLIYALDRSGTPLPNFPVTLSRGTPVAGFFSDPLIVDVDGDKVPDILVPSSDGLVYAYSGKGKQITGQFPLAAGSFEFSDTTDHKSKYYEKNIGSIYPMSIFVTDAVGGDKSRGPELYAFHRSSVSAFRLLKASTDAAENAAAWSLPAGNAEHTGFFDASKLKDVARNQAKDEIREFFIYPNPIRGGEAKVRFELGAEAESGAVEFYDITGLNVFSIKFADGIPAGRNDTRLPDLKQLGSDVYTVRLKVKFKSGKTKQKLYKVGVIR